MRFRLLQVTLVLVAVANLSLALSGCKGKPATPAAAENASAQVSPVTVTRAALGDIVESVELTGTIEPIHQVDVHSEVAGSVAWVGVDVGDTVVRGQALVRLDTALAASGVNQSAAALSAAEARYGQSKVGLQLTKAQSVSNVRQSESAMETARNRLRQTRTAASLTHNRVNDAIEQARIGVRSSEAQLADVRAGARSQEINQAQARVDQARSALKLAKLNLDRMSVLAKNGAVAQAQVDGAQMEYDTAQGSLRVAEQALDLAKEGARTEQVRLAELGVAQAKQVLAQVEAQSGQTDVADRDVRTAEVAVDQAEESVRLARSELARIASTEQDVRAARAGVQQAGAAHSYSQTQVRKHIVYAPISGVVASRNTEPGQSASPGMPLVRIVNLDPLRVSCEASELQVARLRVGQEAQVTVDAFAGREFAGRIVDIAPQERSGQRIYTMRVEMPNPGHLLRAGMFARARIVTGSRQNVVMVPRDTLIERGEKRVVYAVADKVVKVRDVRIGAAQGSKVEITSGVRPGDLLVLGGQSLLADGQQVDPQLQDGNSATAAPGAAAE